MFLFFFLFLLNRQKSKNARASTLTFNYDATFEYSNQRKDSYSSDIGLILTTKKKKEKEKEHIDRNNYSKHYFIIPKRLNSRKAEKNCAFTRTLCDFLKCRAQKSQRPFIALFLSLQLYNFREGKESFYIFCKFLLTFESDFFLYSALVLRSLSFPKIGSKCNKQLEKTDILLLLAQASR